jgi:hypothetical protein
MERGSVFRRCGCRDQATGRLLGARCPGLGWRRHGRWYFSVELLSGAGDRRRVRRGGFATRAAAVAALEALSGPAAGSARGLGTGEWLERWLASRVSLRTSRPPGARLARVDGRRGAASAPGRVRAPGPGARPRRDRAAGRGGRDGAGRGHLPPAGAVELLTGRK